MALLTTCKLIYQEAFPIFLSNNNFTIDGLCSSDYPEGHTFFNNVSEVTFEWHHVVGIISILDTYLSARSRDAVPRISFECRVPKTFTTHGVASITTALYTPSLFFILAMLMGP